MIQNFILENTMCSRSRIESLQNCLDKITRDKIEGDLVECGTWRGGLAALMIDHIERHGLSKTLYIYDTFQGMPEPSVLDDPSAVERFHATKDGRFSDWCRAGLDVVRNTVALASENYSNFTIFVPGLVEETLYVVRPEKISLCRLDTDWYASTRLEFELLYPCVARGGIVIVDDYADWSGCRAAVDEYMSGVEKSSFSMHSVDGSLVIEKR
jgi:O-methyltransferase